MVIRSSNYPRLPRKYWGQLIYATPGCGKTYVANKYRDVIDGDDLIVDAIKEVNRSFHMEGYSDPREVIYKFFRYINFNRRIMWKVYNIAIDKMRDACDIDDVVLFGTLDLIHEADRIFIQEDADIVRDGFHNKRGLEEDRACDRACESDVRVHRVYDYLDNSLQRA